MLALQEEFRTEIRRVERAFGGGIRGVEEGVMADIHSIRPLYNHK